ncbi:MAG: hypothetical protein IJ272_08200 [Clostridia bacterium]|nr:hypothetical protein [Clostridia bacterium]
MKVSKFTIVRTIMMLLVIANIILERMGYDIINVDENSILTLVELLIEIAIMIVGFWKNNSFSEKAIKADEFLQTLRASSDTEDVS